MRLDKFLKVSRLSKRRTLAKQLCDNGLVTINNNKGRASKDVSIDDEITITLRGKKITIRVKELPTGNVNKEKAFEMYELLSHESLPFED